LLRETGADCVVSVVAVPHRYRPDALMDVVDGRLVARGHVRTRNDKTVVYARNGPAVLALRADRLADDLYAGDCRPYVMDERDSLDVDTRFELELADLLLRSR
jgi:N-acylneuraminate cytidylyltransferase